jgi:hypothetical protein
MIYLCSDFEKSFNSIFSHEFYYDGKYYSHNIYNNDDYYMCDINNNEDNKQYWKCEKFDYILPPELNIVSYKHLNQRLEILEKIVEQKILDSI